MEVHLTDRVVSGHLNFGKREILKKAEPLPGA